MAAEEAEIVKFVDKFKQLWQCGFNVHLDLDANAGKAWIGLRLQLSDAVMHRVDRHEIPKKTNARERRKLRREYLRTSWG